MLKQLSVFVENKPGNLMLVTSTLTETGINIRAVASFDTPEFGILRLVVDKAEEAKESLTKKGFVVRVHEVIAVELEDKQGNLNHMLSILANGNINLNYIYSFVIRQGLAPVMVFSSEDPDEASQILQNNGVKVIEENDL